MGNDYRDWSLAACRKGSLINSRIVVKSFLPHEYADRLSTMALLLLALTLVDGRLQLTRLKLQYVRLPSVDRPLFLDLLALQVKLARREAWRKRHTATSPSQNLSRHVAVIGSSSTFRFQE
jgi:hypothetical protein